MKEFETIVIFVLFGFLLRASLIFAGQAWAKSYAQTVAFFLLPMVTYIITKVITGNIALSLGMIGALSIVRFRHPVKSPLELIIYFDLIGLGIATSVRTKWAIHLMLFTIILIISIRLIQKIYNKKHKNFYNLSFNEGAALNTLEVTSKKKINLIEDSNKLIKIIYDKETGYNYLLIFENKESLLKFKSLIEQNDNIVQVNTSLS
jgi:hypothetical protein